MHELSIAQNILEIVRETADKNNAKTISGIELEIGKFSGVEIDALEFTLQTLMENLELQNTTVTIDNITGMGHCNDCGNDFEMMNMYVGCDACKSNSINITAGQELRVKSINVD